MGMNDASYWIENLGLQPHPEGGYYRATSVSKEQIEGVHLDHNEPRHLYTNIYFLLKSGEVSHFHRLKSDEVWYYHYGSSLTIHIIDEKGTYIEQKLGLSLDDGEVPQAIVPKNTIFGSSLLEDEGSFALVSCMVSPGFDFKDFELFSQEELLKLYPRHNKIIQKLAYKKLPPNF